VNRTQTENLPKINLYLESSQFDELFLEALDHTVSILGKGVKQAFFSFLNRKYNLSKEEIPDRIGDFTDGLEQIFGAGASLLELEIIKTLRQSVPSFCFEANSSGLNFEAYAVSLREHVESL